MNNKKLFNGKPTAHWQAMADELVMHNLVRSINNCDGSLPGKLARKRLIGLATAENPELYRKIEEERARCVRNLPLVLSGILGSNRKGRKHTAPK